ncbi:hypothetical protein AU381_00165 [Sinorhizobium glycinis]|uniref:OmpR/PhoB-type domain-containing protein n=1 Tax=Sinorhizobium glycinis TaxID=1472378 RepID=A0A178XYQ7_9HYPH|nr:helix-turn-helix domain-containing protein [Sinorhizobium glycinis]OAP40377.1 hypothetical protein AU381_00165 [Sinorhizobium glycinis]
MMNVIPQVQSYTCPCCNGYIGEAAPIDMVLERVPRGQQKAILELFAKRIGRTVAKAALISSLFDARPDGGPDLADNLINVQVSRLRKVVERHGWSIVTTGGGRGSETFYRLIPTEAGA